jgi:hypothetical protein
VSSHSRKPRWAEGATHISWAHCRRPNCGAKPFVPSKADPATCETCAEEYMRYGRKYFPLCDHWAISDGTRARRCPPCRRIARLESKRLSRARYRERNPEWAAAQAKRGQERRKARYANDPEYRAREAARKARARERNREHALHLEHQRGARYRARHRERVRAGNRAAQQFRRYKLRLLGGTR